jgi:xanthine dehydrogenase accessory factor
LVCIISVDSYRIEKGEIEKEMGDVFTELVAIVAQQKQVVLATIVASDGSSPLPSGAMMLVKSGDGEIVGSVGGGLLEALVIEEAKKYFVENGAPKVGTFDLNDDVSNEGMICGGSVDVLLEPIIPVDLELFRNLLNARNEGLDCTLLRIFDGSSKSVQRVILSSHREILPEKFLSQMGIENGIVSDAIRRSFGKEEIRRVKTVRGEIIIQPVRGLQDLIIFGGGHISKHLAQIATIAGFSTTVIDDREEFANTERFPGASRVLASEYGKAFSKIDVKSSTFVVIVTRGHQSDELVLENAVRTRARYIGMIGSKRKVIATFKNLIERGLPVTDLKKVHAPIGLDIGAVTAEEIAVSIAAEMVRVRRGFDAPSYSISDQLMEWFDNQKDFL